MGESLTVRLPHMLARVGAWEGACVRECMCVRALVAAEGTELRALVAEKLLTRAVP